MLIERFEELLQEDLDNINNLIAEGFSDQNIIYDERINLINNLQFIYLYYALLLKGMAENKFMSDILYNLDKPYTSIDSLTFISRVFLDILPKIGIEGTNLQSNPVLGYLISKNNGNLNISDLGIIDESRDYYPKLLGTIYYLYFSTWEQFFRLLELSGEEIEFLITLGKEPVIDVINKLNKIRYLFEQLEQKNIITNLNMLNLSLLENELNTLDFNFSDSGLDSLLAKEIIIKINNVLKKIFEINPVVFEELKNKGLNLKEENYKSLIVKNFIIAYLLKIIPSNLEVVPFFKFFIDEIKNILENILDSYYSACNSKSEVKIIENSENDFIYLIHCFHPEDKEELSGITNCTGLLKYLNLKLFIFEYILNKGLSAGDIKDITLEIKIHKENTGFIDENRVKCDIVYNLYINNDLVHSITDSKNIYK